MRFWQVHFLAVRVDGNESQQNTLAKSNFSKTFFNERSIPKALIDRLKI